MYTVNAGTSDAVIEYILTTPYDISTATVNNTKKILNLTKPKNIK